MPKILNEVEIRVVAALAEKQVATPEYYPLTLNALVQACNQKNNRDPVVSFDEPTVELALETLREKNLVYVFYGSTSRVPKYKHMMPEIFRLDARQMAVLCVLMLRGAQTPGELKERGGRLAAFADLGDVEATLDSLIAAEDQPLAARLPRQPGQKEVRYVHLLAGEIPAEQSSQPPAEPRPAGGAGERLSKLEGEVATLRAEVEELREKLAAFMRQFDA